MGLDMYLEGRQFFYNRDQSIDSFPIKELAVEIGYWRKHPDLHGAIVNTFADGNDDCQPIELNEADIYTIIQMIKNNELPDTKGFFFGTSAKIGEDYYQEQVTSDIEIFENALKWYKQKDKSYTRYVVYKASW
jgi:hypothetical protein